MSGDNGGTRALVLAGGGLKVAAQAGALQVWLDEAGLEFAHADGASGGTLNLAMYCQGMSGRQIAENWRRYRPLSILALNWPRVLAGPWAPSLFTLNRMRDHQLPAWGLDWQQVRDSARSATFNLYDFSHQQLLTLPPAQMTPDLLMACVALPGWFPPVQRDGSSLIDSVYATDANLGEAIRHGADELWVIWTVERSGRWRPGWLAGYFQVIEASANSRLAEELRLIEENNREIEAGRPGAYGRPIRVRMLEMSVPLHYLLVFRRAAVAAAVEQGITAARAWCAREGIALAPPAEPGSDDGVPELRFSESMQGPVRFTGSVTAAAGGPLREHRLALDLRVAVPDLDAFLRDPRHRAVLTGTVECQALGGTLPVTGGSLDLLTLDASGVTTMHYSLSCTDATGRELHVDGHKTLRHDQDLDLWPDTTRLATVVTGADGELVAEGQVRLSLLGLLRLVATLRGPGAGLRRLVPALRFGVFFLGRLARLYLVPVTRDAPAGRPSSDDLTAARS